MLIGPAHELLQLFAVRVLSSNPHLCPESRMASRNVAANPEHASVVALPCYGNLKIGQNDAETGRLRRDHR